MNKLDTNFLNKAIKLCFLIAVTILCKELGLFSLLGSALIALLPFFVAFFIAWLTRPLSRVIKKHLKVSTHFANLCSIFISILVMFFIVFYLIPTVFMQANVLVSQVYDILENLQKNLSFIAEKFNFHYDFKVIFDFITGLIPCNSGATCFTFALDFVGIIMKFFGGVLFVILQIIFGYIVVFFVIDDFGNLNKGIINVFAKDKELAYARANEISQALYGYIKGTFIVCTTVFCIITVGTSLIGLSTPILFGTVAALFNIIPYAGPYLAAVPIVAVGLSISPLTGLLALCLICGTQFVEAYFLQPKIMGSATHLRPTTIMVGLLIFHSLFGLLGLIICMPIVVVFAKLISFTDIDITL